jgi:hypothetical protein
MQYARLFSLFLKAGRVSDTALAGHLVGLPHAHA